MRGTKIGNYSVTGELGEGGMGKIYVAEHTLMGKRAALKVLRPDLAQDEELVNRFFNEARAATRVNHPGIVDIYDFGFQDDGSAYIVMELLEGEPLQKILERESPLAPERAARLGGQIADALSHAHAASIVHRDLKPDNIFIVPDSAVAGEERAKLLDFGIAKLSAGNSVSLKTRTGALMGTPTYMSPEQCRGASEVDWRSDIYSVGCILFEMATGRPPFVEQGLGELLAAHMMQEVPRVTDYAEAAPRELADVVAWMLAKAADDRPQSMREVVSALAPIAGSTLPPRTSAHIAVPSASQVQGTPTTLSGASGEREGAEARSSSPRLLVVGLGLAGTLGAAAVVSAFVLAGDSGSAGEEEGDESVTAAAADEAPSTAAPAETEPEGEDEGEDEESGGDLSEDERGAAEPADAGSAEAESVVIVLDSSPSEAEVFDASSREELGTTPLELERERGEGELELVVERDGHRPKELSISLAEDAQERVELERVRRPARGGRQQQPDPEPDPQPDPDPGERERDWGDILD